jgi:DNA adenine methylase
MKPFTLFRYVGGKTRLARPILERLDANHVVAYREPFFGGGSIGLRMMMTTSSPNCWINDLDPTIHALWQAVAHYACELKQAIREFIPSVAEFKRIKSDFLSGAPISASRIVHVARDKLALQAMSFGGLGVMLFSPVAVIGSHWLPESLCRRIDLISPHLARARVTDLDFASMLADDSGASLYLDPPYYHAGPDLYQHAFTAADHLRLRDLLRHTGHDWVLSYDDCPQIRDLYSFANIEEVEVTYSVSKSRRTRELLISPRHRNRTILAMAA